MKINAILMASGLSERMGQNKLMLKFKDKEIYKYTLDLLQSLNFDKVVVASSYEEILEDAEKRGFVAIENKDNKIGKSASIRLGVEACDEDAAMMFFVADQPLLTKETCEKLIARFKENQIITYPVVGRRRGAPVIFPPQFRDKLLGLKEDQGGMIFAKDNPTNKVEIGSETELLDIDTVESYEKLRHDHE